MFSATGRTPDIEIPITGAIQLADPSAVGGGPAAHA